MSSGQLLEARTRWQDCDYPDCTFSGYVGCVRDPENDPSTYVWECPACGAEHEEDI